MSGLMICGCCQLEALLVLPMLFKVLSRKWDLLLVKQNCQFMVLASRSLMDKLQFVSLEERLLLTQLVSTRKKI